MATGKDAPAQTEPKSVQDARVDTIGFLNDVADLKEPLVKGVKATMAGKEASIARGDVFEAKLIEAESTVVDPVGWFKLYHDGQITRAEYFEALKVSTETARRILSEKDLAKISTKAPQPARLTIKRMGDEAADVGLALRTLAQRWVEIPTKKAA